MKIKPPVTDLRRLRFSNINSEEFRHLKLLAYWPVFGILFWYAENLYPVRQYNVMYHPIDSIIPFCELFVIPYVFWFAYMIGIHIYTALYDAEAFRKLMKFIIITYTVGLIFFFLYPTCQNLRPAVMPRDNILTAFMKDFYNFDTSTNVCPSLHVVGSMAVMFTAWNTKGLQSDKWKTAFAIMTFLICISTVFLKQHSVIDTVVGFIICVAAYPVCFNENQTAYSRNFRRKSIKSFD